MKRSAFALASLLAAAAFTHARTARAELLFEDQGTDKVTQGCGGTGCWTNYARIVDLDGDGKLDLVFVNCAGFFSPPSAQPLIIEKNDGAGNFTDVSDTAVGGISGRLRQVAIGDIDGDGDVDIFAPDAGGQADMLFINDGTGVFTNEAAARIGTSSSAGATRFADVDNDGDLDLIVLNGYQGADGGALYLNDGTGHFTASAGAFPAIPGDDDPDDVDIADFDGDFDLDVLVNLHTGNDRLWLNDGTGTFTDSTTTLPALAGGNHYGPGVADVDGDGDLDIVIENVAANYKEQLLLNDGHATFTDATSQIHGNAAGSDDNGANFMDYDGDGDMDLAIPALTTEERAFNNDGTGNFTAVDGAFTDLQDGTLWMDFGDLNGDGRLDAMTSQGEQTGGQKERVYFGTSAVAVDMVPPKVIAQSDAATATAADTVVRFRMSDNAVTDDGPRLRSAWVEAGNMKFVATFSGGDVYRVVIPSGAVPDGSAITACGEDLQGNVVAGCMGGNPSTTSSSGNGTGSTVTGATGSTGAAGPGSGASTSGAGGGGSDDSSAEGGCGCEVAPREGGVLLGLFAAGVGALAVGRRRSQGKRRAERGEEKA